MDITKADMYKNNDSYALNFGFAFGYSLINDLLEMCIDFHFAPFKKCNTCRTFGYTQGASKFF